MLTIVSNFRSEICINFLIYLLHNFHSIKWCTMHLVLFLFWLFLVSRSDGSGVKTFLECLVICTVSLKVNSKPLNQVQILTLYKCSYNILIKLHNAWFSLGIYRRHIWVIIAGMVPTSVSIRWGRFRTTIHYGNYRLSDSNSLSELCTSIFLIF